MQVRASLQVAQGGSGGVVAAHAVDSCPGWGGGRADKRAGDPGAVGVWGYAGSDDDLEGVVLSGEEVTADVVGVVLFQLGWSAHVDGEHSFLEAWGEALYLCEDGVGGVAGVAVGDVGVGPDRVVPAGAAAGVGQILLPDQDERPLR